MSTATGYTGEVIETYNPGFVAMGKYLRKFRGSEHQVEVTLINGRVIVREVAQTRREYVVLKSQGDIFGRIFVPPELVMTISEATTRVDVDVNRDKEHVVIDYPTAPHRDFSRKLASISMGNMLVTVNLLTGVTLGGNVVGFDREHVLIQSNDRKYPTYVSYRGIESIHGYKPA